MTGLSVVVETADGALVGAVVRSVSGDICTSRGGGVSSFLVVMAVISAVEILGRLVVWVEVGVEAADVSSGVTGR